LNAGLKKATVAAVVYVCCCRSFQNKTNILHWLPHELRKLQKVLSRIHEGLAPPYCRIRQTAAATACFMPHSAHTTHLQWQVKADRASSDDLQSITVNGHAMVRAVEHSLQGHIEGQTQRLE
jgi:hypothetical protein